MITKNDLLSIVNEGNNGIPLRGIAHFSDLINNHPIDDKYKPGFLEISETCAELGIENILWFEPEGRIIKDVYNVTKFVRNIKSMLFVDEKNINLDAFCKTKKAVDYLDMFQYEAFILDNSISHRAPETLVEAEKTIKRYGINTIIIETKPSGLLPSFWHMMKNVLEDRLGFHEALTIQSIESGKNTIKVFKK